MVSNQEHANKLCIFFTGRKCLDVGLTTDGDLFFNFGDNALVLKANAEFEIWNREKGKGSFSSTIEAREPRLCQ